MFDIFENIDSKSALIKVVAVFAVSAALWFFLLDLLFKIFIRSSETIITVSIIRNTIFLIAVISYLLYIVWRFQKNERKLQDIINENERLYRRIFDLSPIGMTMVDVKGNIVDANTEYCKLSGYDYSEIIKRNVRDLVPLQEKDKVGKNIELIMEGHILNHDVRTLKKDNTLAYFNLLETRIQLPGRKSGILVIAQDMTEKRLLVEKIRENQKLLDTFFNSSSVGFYIMLLDEPVFWNKNIDNEENLKYVLKNERIVKFNSAIVKLYGIDEKNLTGMNHIDLYENIFEHSEDYWQKLYDEGKLRLVMRITNDENVLKWIEGNYICLYDESGRIKGHIGIQYDITEHVEEQNKYLNMLKSFESEWRENNHLLKNSFNELLKKVELLTCEICGIEKSIAEKPSVEEDKKERIKEIRSLSENIEKNIGYFYNFTDLKSKSDKPIFTIINLSDVLKKVEEVYRPKADKKNIKYIFQNGIGESIIDGERRTIVRLLSLLIENAIKNSESGEMFVKLKREEKLQLEIEFEPLNPIAKNYSDNIQTDKLLTAIVNEYCDRNGIDISISKGDGSGTKIALLFQNTI